MRRNRELLPVRRELEGGFSPWSESSLFGPSPLFTGSPWQMMRRMQSDLDSLFDQLVQPMNQQMQRLQQSWAPSVDISQDDKEWLIEAELPGVDKDNIHVEVRRGHLVLRAELREEHHQPQGAEAGKDGGNGNGNGNGGQQGGQSRQYHQRERRYGFFERVFPLPENVNEEQIHCDFRDGLLKVHLPLIEPQKPRERRIPINSAAPQQALNQGAQPGAMSEPQFNEPKREMAVAGSKGGQRTGGQKTVAPKTGTQKTGAGKSDSSTDSTNTR